MDQYQTVADIYDSFLADGYAEIAADPTAFPLLPTLERLGGYGFVQEGKSVLDLGCGPGLLKDHTQFAYYAGLDLSPDMLDAAAKRGYSELIQASFEEYLPLLPDNAFDAVICFSALYFVAPDKVAEVIRHIDRVAKEFWLLTLDGIPGDLAAYYRSRYDGLEMYDHTGLEIAGVTDRYTVPGWISALDRKPVPMEIVVRRK